MNIKVIGCILSTYFHTTKFIVNNLVKLHPDLINTHVVKGVMDVDWAACLWKLNQSLGDTKHQDSVAVFVDKNYIGTYVELQEFFAAKYNFTIGLWPLNYEQLVWIEVQKYFNNNKFTYVRMIFDVNDWEIGHIIFALYDQLVPATCEYFKQLCLDKAEGYVNSHVHRVDVEGGFIQAGRIASRMPYLKKENHVVSHDRRGVLSLAGRQTHFNGPEFVVSLRPNLWMNGKYVAFGRAVGGEKTLKIIETLCHRRRTVDGDDRPPPIRVTLCEVLPRPNSAAAAAADPDAQAAFLRTVVRQCVPGTVCGAPVYDGRPQEPHVATADGTVRQTGPAEPPDSDASNGCRNAITRRSTVDADPDSDRRCCIDKLSASPISRTDETTFWNDDGTSTGLYGVRLPKNHKDYWKHKHIYESIAK